MVWSAQYTAFGEAVIDVDTIENNLRFPGQYYDAETGLHYNFHRYYDPKTERYLTIDPIRFIGNDVNWYRYSYNNPIAFDDPLGLKPRAGFAAILSFEIDSRRGLILGESGVLVTVKDRSCDDQLEVRVSGGVFVRHDGLGVPIPFPDSLKERNIEWDSADTKPFWWDTFFSWNFTSGEGTGEPMPIYPFPNNIADIFPDTYRESVTYGGTLYYHPERNQITYVGAIGYRNEDKSIFSYNDAILLGGGGTDMQRTGGGTFTARREDGSFFRAGHYVFTGEGNTRKFYYDHEGTKHYRQPFDELKYNRVYTEFCYVGETQTACFKVWHGKSVPQELIHKSLNKVGELFNGKKNLTEAEILGIFDFLDQQYWGLDMQLQFNP